MVCKNGGIYGFLGAWWVLINMVPRNSVGAETVGVGNISPRNCRRRMLRYGHLLGCRAIELGKPPQAGVIYTAVYGTCLGDEKVKVGVRTIKASPKYTLFKGAGRIRLEV